ncbi:MAG: polymer-forming cytoskeletal protein [Candidatus Omnitrophica bacterium]|nr:polymer-forming cytoskeletal protein [Candidatus Omnitrophota bacterium]
MFKKTDRSKTGAKVIDIEAGMEGNIKFSTPVNLRISGNFEGELDTRGNLIIGKKANVKAKIINGENITIAGKVRGDIVSTYRLELSPSAKVIGNIKAPVLVISEGAMLKGKCQMPIDEEKSEPKKSSKEKK